MKTFQKRTLEINQNLIQLQNLSKDDILKVSKIHKIKDCFYSVMEKEQNIDKLKYISKILTQIEFRLQSLWRFEQDIIFHRFWEVPKCECPKMDNEDVYGTGHRYINSNCIIHGK